MKYCPKCKKLYNEQDIICSQCKNKTLISIENGDTLVYLCDGNAFQRDCVMATLEDSGIPSTYENQSESIGMGFESYNILVQYKYYKKAYDIAVGMGALEYDENVELMVEETEMKAEFSEFEQMSPAKRTTVKVLSAILFIIVACLVIFGTDYVMQLIKNFFM